MKKVFATVLVILSMFTFITFASADDAANVPVPSGIVGVGIPFNLQGDTAFLLKHQNFGAGIGTDLASVYNGMITIRAEALAIVDKASNQSSQFVGIGPMVNIPNIIQKLGGTWSMKVINPSIGIMPFYNLAGGKDSIDVGVVVSIIKLTF